MNGVIDINGLAKANGAPVLRPDWADTGEPPKRFSFIYPPDIQLRPREWLVPKLIPRRGFGVLFGPSGCGKSFWAVDLALCLATGRDFLGRPVRQSGAIYVAAEDADGVQFRTSAWFSATGEDADAPFAIVPEAPDLWSSEDGDADRLIEAINQEATVLREMGAPPGLIILDTMRDVTPGMNENGSDDMSRATRTFRRIGDETGALVIVVHHVPKGGDGEDPRGSTALIGAADVALGVKAEDVDGETVRSLWVRKQRNGADARGDKALRWTYRLAPVELDVVGEDGAPERSCVVETETAERPQRSPGEKRLTPAAVIVRKSIVALLSDGAGQKPPATVPCPAGGSVIAVSAARTQARKQGLFDDANNDPMGSSAKAFDRARKELLAKGVIYEMEGWIWLA